MNQTPATLKIAVDLTPREGLDESRMEPKAYLASESFSNHLKRKTGDEVSDRAVKTARLDHPPHDTDQIMSKYQGRVLSIHPLDHVEDKVEVEAHGLGAGDQPEKQEAEAISLQDLAREIANIKANAISQERRIEQLEQTHAQLRRLNAKQDGQLVEQQQELSRLKERVSDLEKKSRQDAKKANSIATTQIFWTYVSEVIDKYVKEDPGPRRKKSAFVAEYI
ncbi:hypothetical protein L228DRAFT_286299 [Xylona heveae TC161]|uniref:Uncharacterized protein n=1 Tax=Xylona heveae (strain CBS 132557 / TC161) TaxID=1328760 RepID=A0A164ZGH5_XYLHT|nr:hypothetical protein L228DRAFT_286299 [Xylona heveae TC161]KZF19076.1 hypothetical protein L228DRAFT_286299 [Xylona heveae TC161]